MKTLGVFLCVMMTSSLVHSMTSPLDCDFNGARKFCRWRSLRFGMRRGGWRRGVRVRHTHITDPQPGGKIAYFRARSRPEGFRSQLRSPTVDLLGNRLCFSMQYAVGGSYRGYPDGLSALKVYLVGPGESPDMRMPIFTAGGNDGYKSNNFQSFDIPVNPLDDLKTSLAQIVIETIRGGSKKAYVAIDDVKLYTCRWPKTESIKFIDIPEPEVENKKSDIVREVLGIMLPARRSPPLVKSASPGDEYLLPPSDGMSPAFSRPLEIWESPVSRPNRRRKSRGKKRRKNRKGKKRRRKRPRQQTGVAVSRGPHPHNKGLRPAFMRVTMCDFIEYTQRLQRCFRAFFSQLQKRPKTCRTLYDELELCLQTAAQSCIPSRDLTREQIVDIVTHTMRVKFHTRQVYCEEEGAFVFPDYRLDALPLQCGPRYFLKLSECSGPFSSIFHIKHGDPKLCTEYYSANECQRQATAEECNFDADTMLRYGLNLQYQFGHNPFCVHLPYSSWWPES